MIAGDLHLAGTTGRDEEMMMMTEDTPQDYFFAFKDKRSLKKSSIVLQR